MDIERQREREILNSIIESKKKHREQELQSDENEKHAVSQSGDENIVLSNSIVVDEGKSKRLRKKTKKSKDSDSIKAFRLETFVYLTILVLFVGLLISNNLGAFSFLNGIWADMAFDIVLQVGILFLLPITWISIANKMSIKNVFKKFSYRKIKFKWVAISLGIGACVFLINICVSSFFSGIIDLLGYESSGSSSTTTSYTLPFFITSVISTAILPALCEETTHRGLLLGALSKFGVKWAILLSGLMFGLMHLNINQFFYAALIGILLGFIVLLTRSIWPAIIIHFTNNFVNVYFGYAEPNGWFGGDFFNILNNINSILPSGVGFIVIVAGLLLVFGVMIWLIEGLFIDIQKDKMRSAQKIKYKEYLANLLASSSLEEVESLGNVPSEEEYFDRAIKKEMLKMIQPNGKISWDKVLDTEIVKQKPKLKDKIFLYTALCLGIVLTIFSFVWGLL